MLVLIRKNADLYVKVMMKLKAEIKYKNVKFDTREFNGLLLHPDEVYEILMRNGNIKLWNGNCYKKFNLDEYHEIMRYKKYQIEDFVEPKKVVNKIEPKVEVKPEPVVEEPKVEVKKEQPKKEYNNDKKQRHNNNNKQQGGGK